MPALLALTLLLAACSASTTTDTGGDAPVDVGADSSCPVRLPEIDSSCAQEGLRCEYGERPSCLSFAECTAGRWQLGETRCAPPPTRGCPPSRTTAQGSACPGDERARCYYEDRLACECTTCPNPYPVCMEVDPPVWACEAPNPDESCPAARPNLGSACTAEAQVCDYGCEPDRRRVCEGGMWTASSQPGGCPMSTRRAKRDIEYLRDPDIDELAAQVQRTRLATYEYIDPARAGRRHLGFIIEDQPASYSVDPERSQVDLYGYTSMLVAAIQTQERRILSLENELRQLRAEH